MNKKYSLASNSYHPWEVIVFRVSMNRDFTLLLLHMRLKIALSSESKYFEAIALS